MKNSKDKLIKFVEDDVSFFARENINKFYYKYKFNFPILAIVSLLIYGFYLIDKRYYPNHVISFVILLMMFLGFVLDRRRIYCKNCDNFFLQHNSKEIENCKNLISNLKQPLNEENRETLYRQLPAEIDNTQLNFIKFYSKLLIVFNYKIEIKKNITGYYFEGQCLVATDGTAYQKIYSVLKPVKELQKKVDDLNKKYNLDQLVEEINSNLKLPVEKVNHVYPWKVEKRIKIFYG